jgi:hypothetical protein
MSGCVIKTLNDADCPEITGRIFIGQTGMGQGETIRQAPPAAPRMADDEPLFRLTIAAAGDRMAGPGGRPGAKPPALFRQIGQPAAAEDIEAHEFLLSKSAGDVH